MLAISALLVDDYEQAMTFFVGCIGFALRQDTDLKDGKRWDALRKLRVITSGSVGLLSAPSLRRVGGPSGPAERGEIRQCVSRDISHVSPVSVGPNESWSSVEIRLKPSRA